MQIRKILPFQLESTKLFKKLTIIFLLILLIGSLLLRIIKIEALPLGLSPNEINLASQASDYLEKNINLQTLNEKNNLAPTSVYVVLSSMMIKFFGKTIFAIRILDVSLGILSVLLLYLWLNKAYSKRVALVAVFIMSSLPWSLYLARGGEIGANLLIFSILLSEWLISLIRIKPRWQYFVFLGLAIGLGFYSQSGFIFWLIFKLLILSNKMIQRKVKPISLKYLISILTSVVVLIPVIINQFNTKFYSIKNVMSNTIFTDNNLSLSTKILRPINEVKILSFNGDSNPLHGLAYQPLLNGFLAIMLLLGVLLCIVKFSNSIYRYPLLAGLVLFLPNFINTKTNLDSYQLAGALPYIVLLTTLGINYFLENWNQQIGKNHLAQKIGLALISTLLILSTMENCRLYFLAYAQDIPVHQAYREENLAIANFLNQNLTTDKNTFLYLDEKSVQAVKYLTENSSNFKALDNTGILNIPLEPKPQYIIISTNDKSESELNNLLNTIKGKFPEAIVQGETGKYNPEILYYLIVI